MASMEVELFAGLGVSLGVGLLVGLERQQSMARKGAQVVPAGLRTFPLFSLTGSLLWLLGGGSPALPLVGLLVLAALLAAHRLGSTVEHREHGLTTEAAALVTFLLGMLVMADALLVDFEVRLITTGALGTIVALLLSLKPRVQAILRHISEDDLLATLQLLVVALVLLPLLPDAGLGPYGAINPAHTGRMILLVGGVSWVGFVASRLLGAGRGLILTGLVGGLVSSTAVALNMARRARAEPAVVDSCVVAIAAANAMMLARVLLTVAVVAPDLARTIAVPLGTMLVAGLLALAPQLGVVGRARDAGGVTLLNPFELGSAVIFGLLFSGVHLVVHVIRATLGDSALVVAGLAAGLTDVDAITLSTATLADAGLSPAIAGATILAAVASNTVLKAGLAFTVGGRRLGLQVLRVAAVTLVVGAVATVALWDRTIDAGGQANDRVAHAPGDASTATTRGHQR